MDEPTNALPLDELSSLAASGNLVWSQCVALGLGVDHVGALVGAAGEPGQVVAVVAALAALLADREQPLPARLSAAGGLAQVAERPGPGRNACMRAMIAQLERAEQDDVRLNTTIVTTLVKLRCAPAAVAIGRAYHVHRVDESVCGSWEQVRYKLGVGPRPAAAPAGPARSAATKQSAPSRARASSRSAPADTAARRARRRQADKSRKRNRRKKRK